MTPFLNLAQRFESDFQKLLRVLPPFVRHQSLRQSKCNIRAGRAQTAGAQPARIVKQADVGRASERATRAFCRPERNAD